jgi:hypothetical protein
MTWTSPKAGLPRHLFLDTQDANGFGTPLTINGPSWLDVPTN